jgi:hypothetical protein
MFICALCTFSLFYSASAFCANDWLTRYVARPAAEVSLTDSLLSASSATRSIINLNGRWEARLKGEAQWHSVFVPGAYEFEGEVEFRRVFAMDANLASKAVHLIALGINNRCEIYFNHSFVGAHHGGHTSFELEIPTEALHPHAENEIRVVVDNRLLSRASLPPRYRPHFPFNYGGIFRDIYLQISAAVAIEDVRAAETFAADYTRCQLIVEAHIQNRLREQDDPVAWRAEVWDGAGEVLIGRSQPNDLMFTAGAANGAIALDIPQPTLWTPDRPALYQLRLSLTRNSESIDEVVKRIGFKDFRIAGGRFMLNDQPFEIKGFDWAETAVDAGAVFSAVEARRQAQRIKASGANLVRIFGTPAPPFFLDACDEIGLLVFQETPLHTIPDNFFLNPEFVDLAQNYFEEMLKRDALHVAMAGWGFGSDLLAERPATVNFLNELRERLRKRSPLPTYLSFRFVKKIGPVSGFDFAIGEGYYRSAEQIIDMSNSLAAVTAPRPLLLSLGFPLLIHHESGGVAPAMDAPLHSEMISKYRKAQQAQAEMLRGTLARLDSTRRAAGILFHTFSDWREARPNLIFAREPAPHVHRSGVAAAAETRLAYETARAFFANAPAEVTPAAPSDAHYPIIYPVAGLASILIFLFNLNRDPRLRANLRRIFLYPHGFYVELRERRRTPFFHTILLSFVISLLLSIILSSIAFRFREHLLFNSLLDLFFTPPPLKLMVIRLIWNPLLFIPICFLALIVLGVFVTIFLRTLDLVIGENTPATQFYTMVVWDSANFLWLLPIVPIYYRIISQTGGAKYAILLVLLFAVWTAIRIFRGSRVVFNLTLFNALFTAVILGLLILGGAWWYIDQRYALFDYWPFYRAAF